MMLFVQRVQLTKHSSRFLSHTLTHSYVKLSETVGMKFCGIFVFGFHTIRFSDSGNSRVVDRYSVPGSIFAMKGIRRNFFFCCCCFGSKTHRTSHQRLLEGKLGFVKILEKNW